jgi:hypothetical protein
VSEPVAMGTPELAPSRGWGKEGWAWLVKSRKAASSSTSGKEGSPTPYPRSSQNWPEAMWDPRTRTDLRNSGPWCLEPLPRTG